MKPMLIVGTGKCGSSVLVRILWRAGLKIGVSEEQSIIPVMDSEGHVVDFEFSEPHGMTTESAGDCHPEGAITDKYDVYKAARWSDQKTPWWTAVSKVICGVVVLVREPGACFESIEKASKDWWMPGPEELGRSPHRLVYSTGRLVTSLILAGIDFEACAHKQLLLDPKGFYQQHLERFLGDRLDLDGWLSAWKEMVDPGVAERCYPHEVVPVPRLVVES